jgi:hypothetical protein
MATSMNMVVYWDVALCGIQEDSRLKLLIAAVLNLWSAYSGSPRLFRKLNNFSQQINTVHTRKKAKSEIENFKTLCRMKEFKIGG